VKIARARLFVSSANRIIQRDVLASSLALRARLAA
jgi:hypothetical protein